MEEILKIKNKRTDGEYDIGILLLGDRTGLLDWAKVVLKRVTSEEQPATFFTSGLPSLASIGGSTHKSSTNSNVANATFKEKPFGIIDPEFIPLPDASLIWIKQSYYRSALPVSAEATIEGYVVLVLEELLKNLGLLENLTVSQQIGIFRAKPDIWIVFKNGIPIGVVEVKKPAVGVMSHPKVLGQILLYMTQLKSFYGIQDIFGIVTTYEEWRICWLPECDGAASSDRRPTEKVEEANIEHLNDADENSGEEVEPLGDGEQIQANEVHGTKVINWSDKSLYQTLKTVLLKMFFSRRRDVKLIDSDRLYLVMNQNEWRWKKYPFPKAFKLRSREFPLNTEKEFVFLEDLHGGRDGRCWSVCSLSGRVAVVKFMNKDSQNDNSQTKAEEEAKNWRICYGDRESNYVHSAEKTKAIQLGSRWAVMMPRYTPYKGDNHSDELLDNACLPITAKNLKHPDKRWQNLLVSSPTKLQPKERLFMGDLHKLEKLISFE
eukprot:TRINITY_DN8271_c0_g1_i1.p1 TRINITY_DN8271_c0_g1~~TRINITY_DN8271_c0_g1_i1.p1  ORF type:complete len:516 (-),score=92.47 TRINITY_DN8271_c0_g1_i1:98-1570(-)